MKWEIQRSDLLSKLPYGKNNGVATEYEVNTYLPLECPASAAWVHLYWKVTSVVHCSEGGRCGVALGECTCRRRSTVNLSKQLYRLIFSYEKELISLQYLIGLCAPWSEIMSCCPNSNLYVNMLFKRACNFQVFLYFVIFCPILAEFCQHWHSMATTHCMSMLAGFCQDLAENHEI